MTSYLFELSKDWNVSSCGQIQSCKFWCRCKKWFQIFKRLFTDVFQKNAALATPAFLLKTRTQMVKGTNMKKLLLLIYLTPETLSNHKKLCSIKFKNEERLFRENFFKFCLKDCILRSHHFSAEGTFKHFFGFKLEHFFLNIALTCKKPCNVTVKCTYLKSVLLFQV